MDPINGRIPRNLGEFPHCEAYLLVYKYVEPRQNPQVQSSAHHPQITSKIRMLPEQQHDTIPKIQCRQHSANHQHFVTTNKSLLFLIAGAKYHGFSGPTVGRVPCICTMKEPQKSLKSVLATCSETSII